MLRARGFGWDFALGPTGWHAADAANASHGSQRALAQLDLDDISQRFAQDTISRTDIVASYRSGARSGRGKRIDLGRHGHNASAPLPLAHVP